MLKVLAKVGVEVFSAEETKQGPDSLTAPAYKGWLHPIYDIAPAPWRLRWPEGTKVLSQFFYSLVSKLSFFKVPPAPLEQAITHHS